MASSFYLRLHLGDYATATADLGQSEHGAYLGLLRWYYATGGPLPADLPRAYARCSSRTAADRAAVRYVLARFFELREDHYHQARADTELGNYSKLMELKRNAALARWKQTNTAESTTEPMHPHSTRIPSSIAPAMPAVAVALKALTTTALPLSYDSAREAVDKSTAGEKKKRAQVNGSPAQRVQQLAAGLAARLTAPTSARPPAAQRVPGKPAAEWWRTEAGIEREGKRRNLPAKPGESWRDWALRLRATPEPP